MARPPVPGEKPLFWVGSSKRDLLAFPAKVRDRLGTGLSVAQFGRTHPAAKPWKGLPPGVMELVDDYDGDTYRAVYTVQFKEAIYVLHAFQKKSKQGIRTPQLDKDLVARRLKAAQREYQERYGKSA